MTPIDIINVKLNELYIELISYASSIEFVPVCEFNLENSNERMQLEKLDSSGLYLIEIKNDLKHSNFLDWVANFKETWENARYKGGSVSNLIKKRISRHSELNEWIPLYIGKSKKIGVRISEHLYKPLEKGTFAMKLKARGDLINEVFRLSVINFPLENYDWVAPVFEKTLRDRINPIIGRQ